MRERPSYWKFSIVVPPTTAVLVGTAGIDAGAGAKIGSPANESSCPARKILTAIGRSSASYFVKVSEPMTIASPVPEGSTKPQNDLQFVSSSEKVRTIATWIPASKQILDDMTELANFINNSIGYFVDLAEEIGLLFGDGTGENLHGLCPQASIFNPAGMPSGYTRIDVIGAAIEAVETAKEIPPTFAVLNPGDWWGMKMLKDTLGRYILGDPQSVAPPRIFDLDVVSTVSMPKGSFLIGSGNPVASEIRDRMQLTIEVSTEHANYFIQNLVAVRGEKRLALVVKRPASYLTGTFTGAA